MLRLGRIAFQTDILRVLMIAVVIRAGRLLEHVMSLVVLSPYINPEYLSAFVMNNSGF